MNSSSSESPHPPTTTWAGYFQSVYESPCYEESQRTSYNLVPTDWQQPFTPKFPCAMFYWTQNPVDIDQSCWTCLRRQIEHEINIPHQSCIFTPCALQDDTQICEPGPCPNLLEYSETNVPPVHQLETWMDCIQNHPLECSETIRDSLNPRLPLTPMSPIMSFAPYPSSLPLSSSSVTTTTLNQPAVTTSTYTDMSNHASLTYEKPF